MTYVVSIVWTALAGLILWLCWAAGRGSIPVNHIAGIRIRSTMRSLEAWRAGHRAAVPAAAVALLIQIVLLALAFVVAPPVPEIAGLVVAFGSLAVIVVFAKRAADAS